jgi:predicted site-specific integrase-resolvase
VADAPAGDRLLYPAEAAAVLKVTTKALRRLREAGRLRPFRTIGRHCRYPEGQVLALRDALEAERDLLTTADVARVFRVGPERVCVWVNQGKLTPVPGLRGPGGQYLFRPEAVEKLLNGGGEGGGP